MPRYLAIDYLAQSIQERQNTLYRTLLAVPHHLECVDNYAHNGKIDDKLYHVPWEKELPSKSSDQKPEDDLSVITCNISRLECFSDTSKTLADEVIPSSNPDSPLVNFDVWTDLEEEVLNYVVESFQTENEEFFTDATYDEDEYLLEEQESIDVLCEAKLQIPTLSILCSRLKSKTVQDPFTDSKGNPISEYTAFMLDKTFTLSNKELVLKRNQVFKETFTLQHLETAEEDVLEKNMQLEIPSFDSPAMAQEKGDEKQELISKVFVHLSKDDTSYATEEMSLEEIEDIVGEKHHVTRIVKSPLFNNAVMGRTLMSGKSVDFVTINMEELTDLDEKAHLLDTLESPQLAHNERINADSKDQYRVMKDLSPMSLSPDSEINFVTPSSKLEIVNKIWQDEKMFNDILVKTLPEPRIPQTKVIAARTCIEEVRKMLSFRREEIKGDLELQLSWDPLLHVPHLSDMQNRLCRVEIMCPKKDNKQRSVESLRETFQIVPWQGENTLDGLPWNEGTESCDSNTSIDTKLPRQPTCVKRAAPEYHPKHINTNSKICDANCSDVEGNPFSSLDDFLILRSVQPVCSNADKAPVQTCRPPKTVVKAAKVRPSMSSSAEGKSTPSHLNVNACQKDTPRKTEQLLSEVKRKVVSVELSAEFQEIVEFLSASIHPFLARLKESGIIHQERHLEDLTPDYTRFVMKQLEVSLVKTSEDDKDLRLTYTLAICLHALVGALDLLIHCGVSVALAYLSHVHEKYTDYIGNTLESIRRHLFNAHFKFQQNSVLHPKIIKVLDTIKRWASDNERFSNTSGKVLIIANRHVDQLYKELKDIISSFGGIRVYLLINIPEQAGLHSSDVVIASTEAVNALQFPWNLFSFVIEYDYKITSDIKPGTHPILHEHVALMMQCGGKDMTRSYNEGPTDSVTTQSVFSQDQYIFIGSTKIVTNTKLLHLLEARHNIMIFERDYSSLVKSKNDSQTKMNLQPDILVDERTCIVIIELNDLQELVEYEKLKDLVLSLSLKCLTCYVILCCGNSGNTESITTKISSHLFMLFATAAHFKHTKNDFKLEIVYAITSEDTAVLVRRIGDHTRQESKAWDPQEWVKRKWLTDEMSLHERFLLSFPCINSFSAQVMLTAASLSQLLTMTLKELKTACPWIPESILSMFHYTTQLSSSATVETHPNNSNTPLSCERVFNTTSNTETDYVDQTVSIHLPQHIQGSMELARDAPVDHQPRTPVTKTINTPKSYVSDDSLWLAMENDGIDSNLDVISTDLHGSNLHDNLESLKDLFPENHNTKENENAQGLGLLKNYFEGHHQKSFLRYSDNEPSIPKNNTIKSFSLERAFLPSAPPTAGRNDAYINAMEYNGKPQDTRTDGDTQAQDEKIQNKQRTSNAVPLYVTRRSTDVPRREIDVRDSINHPHHQQYMKPSHLGLPYNWHDSRTVNYNYYPTTTRKCAPGASLFSRGYFDSGFPQSNWSENLYYQTSQYFGNVQDSVGANSLVHNNPDRRFNISTNVGVAQPLRRPKGRDDKLATPGNTRNNHPPTKQYHHSLPMFEDLFGSTPIKASNQRKALKEHEVPDRLEPSPDDYLNELSIFSTLSDNQVPTKKQKLTYEKVPGAKDGQTKLTFT